MKKLLALPIAAGILAGCGDVVRVELVPPVVSGLVTQANYCTSRDTILDFQFKQDKGLITAVEVAVTDDTDAATPPANVQGSGQFKVSLTSTGYVGYVLLDSSAPSGIQSLSVSGQAIIVTPTGNKRLWLRAFNGNAASPWLKATGNTAPSTEANCDPIFPYGQP